MNNPDAIAPSTAAQTRNGHDVANRRASCSSENSQTAKEFIESQMRLEADAREILPYSFDSCTKALGPLRQSLFACLTCNPPPSTADTSYTPAGVCYSCSIACHGEHTLVELFNKRNFVCDCGTTRVPASTPCTLRSDSKTGAKGVHSEEPHVGNRYNGNFQNKFCGCGEDYDAHEEKGTMFQCLGLGTFETGGCGEDWWHPECLIGLSRDWYKDLKKKERTEHDTSTEKVIVGDDDDDDETPLPPGFPAEDDFETFICYKCIESNSWLKKYAGTPGFLPPIFKEGGLPKSTEQDRVPVPGQSALNPESDSNSNPKKRKAEDDDDDDDDDDAESGNEPVSKRPKEDNENKDTSIPELPEHQLKSEPEQQSTAQNPNMNLSLKLHPPASSPSSSKKTSGTTFAAAPNATQI
ncbi:hypothetical protein ARAM_005884 [Aspergillus rambellii]|uniref:UBR-type domain-containing protein n=1 Tax=Aspergillus rambellii TaxID=308745 RepID=A0A0F8U6W5_9EURO|nr:hypothetical protein ARAM_005884 [Aspergillus rambellii]